MDWNCCQLHPHVSSKSVKRTTSSSDFPYCRELQQLVFSVVLLFLGFFPQVDSFFSKLFSLGVDVDMLTSGANGCERYGDVDQKGVFELVFTSNQKALQVRRRVSMVCGHRIHNTDYSLPLVEV